MKLTVLGSGTSVPDPSRVSAGFLVGVGARSWLVDGGSGALTRCAAAGVPPGTLAGGFYTHRHPDHCADLVPLLFSMRVHPTPGVIAPYRIWAGAGFAAYLEALQDLYGQWIDPAPRAVTVTELPLDGPGHVDLGDLVVRSRPAQHKAGALHLRFEAGGRSIALSGDTAPSDELVALARGVDLLVCECASTGPDGAPGHMWPEAVRELVAEASPREVWLHHLYPDVDPARAVATVQAGTSARVRHCADLDAWLTPTRS